MVDKRDEKRRKGGWQTFKRNFDYVGHVSKGGKKKRGGDRKKEAVAIDLLTEAEGARKGRKKEGRASLFVGAKGGEEKKEEGALLVKEEGEIRLVT